jgi:DNA-directed RNA polymerase specialized sigma24 family protein
MTPEEALEQGRLFAARTGATGAAGEDVAQEYAVAAVLAQGKARHPANLWCYQLTAGCRRAMDETRRQAGLMAGGVALNGHALRMGGREGDPADAAESDDDARAVREALAALPPVRAAMASLVCGFAGEAMSVHAAGRVLGLSPREATRHWRLAKDFLRATLTGKDF